METFIITFAIGHVLEQGRIFVRTTGYNNTPGISLRKKYAKIRASSRADALREFEEIFGPNNYAAIYFASEEDEFRNEYGYTEIFTEGLR